MDTLDPPPFADDPNGSAQQRGAVLRAFREHSGLLQKSAERRVGLSDATLSSWERAGRGAVPSTEQRERVRQLADLYGAPGVMPALWGAVGTVDGLPARRDWARNFSQPGQPCWVWVRAVRECVAHVSWGVALHGTVHVPAGRGGVLVRFPTSVRNPPLEVSLTSPGWVDSGSGALPPAVAAAVAERVVDAATIHDGGAAQDAEGVEEPDVEAVRDVPLLSQALRALAAEVDIRWDLVAPYVPRVLLPAREQSLDPADLPGTSVPGVPEVDDVGLTRCLLLPPGQVRRLREARGLTREVTGRLAAELGDGGLGRSTLERLEKDGRLPTAPAALARLDHLLGADGRLGLERTFDSGPARGSGSRTCTVAFPAWWVGPVWLQAFGPEGRAGTAVLRLRWWPWRRTATVSSGTVLTTRKAPSGGGEPSQLTVQLPEGWRLIAGTGAVSAARDIGRDWKPVSLRAAWAVLSESVAAMQVAGTTRLRFRGPLR